MADARAQEDVAAPKRRFARRARIGMLSQPSAATESDAAGSSGRQRTFTAVLTHSTLGVLSFKVSAAAEAAVLTEATRQAKYRGGRWRIRVYEGVRLIAAREPGCPQWQRPGLPPSAREGGPSTGGQGAPRDVTGARGETA